MTGCGRVVEGSGAPQAEQKADTQSRGFESHHPGLAKERFGYRYRDWHIRYDPPPIPIRTSDWHAYHDNYDGAPIHSFGPPADDRAFSAASLEDCIAEIDEREDEAA